MLMVEARTPMFKPSWAFKRMTVRKLLDLPLIPDAGWFEWFKLAGIRNANLTFAATRL